MPDEAKIGREVACKIKYKEPIKISVFLEIISFYQKSKKIKVIPLIP